MPGDARVRASQRYRRVGRLAEGFANGKMAGDPAYRRVMKEVPDEGTLVDVGCGEGYLLAWARERCPDLQLWGFDHDPRRIEVGRRALADEPSVRLRVVDVREAELPPADVVACLDVLHYMVPLEQDALLDRLAAAVRPGGVVLIRDAHADGGLRTWLTRGSERLLVTLGRHRGDGVFLRARSAVVDRLAGAGLEVQVEDCHHGTPFANVLYVARRAP